MYQEGITPRCWASRNNTRFSDIPDVKHLETLGGMVTQTCARPEWGDSKKAKAIFGLSRTSLYRLASAGRIKSASLRERGQAKGKRLFSMDSIADYIEKQAASELSQLNMEAAPREAH